MSPPRRAFSVAVYPRFGDKVLVIHHKRLGVWLPPGGELQAGETPLEAAVRELEEETGLRVAPGALVPLGTHAYMPKKALALFLWRVPALPEPKGLHCRSTFTARDGAVLPEFDRFALFPWPAVPEKVGRNLARLLDTIRLDTAG